jgi:hypothetical protein
MVGVTDLKAILGIPVRNPDGRVDESGFHDAISKMIATSKETGVQLMIPAFRLKPDDVNWLQNFKMVVTSVDILSVMKTHRADLAKMKEALGNANGVSNGASNGRVNGKTNGKLNGVNNGAVNRATNGVTNGAVDGYH